LIKKYGYRCFIYLQQTDRHKLQIDHRVPFEVAGEAALNTENFMLLCPSANRAKPRECEQCENCNKLKDISICSSCYWAYPENYTHVAMQEVRRIDLIWEGDEIEIYEQLRKQASQADKSLTELIKEMIERQVNELL
jgi:hypothetical protein